MQYQYIINGMTCGGCEAKVKKTLEAVPEVQSVDIISFKDNLARLTAKKQPDLAFLQNTLNSVGNYTIQSTGLNNSLSNNSNTTVTEKKEDISLFKSLYPLLLVFAFLIGAVLLRQFYLGQWNGMQMMSNFMGGFFVIFSFFKLLDLSGFAMAFRGYDPITKLWPGYAYLYPFIELGLGIAFLCSFQLFWVNLITLVVVSIGTIGVAQKVLNKESIQCACLGTVFNLPMTKVTLTENSVMIVMAVAMLLGL
jgi:copper chaperone CopZ